MGTSATGGHHHASLMDRLYRRQRYIYDLTRKYYLFGRDRLIREMELPKGAAVIEVGCGTARNLIRIARLYPTARLYGLDASTEMLKTAAAAVERAGLADRVILKHAYAEDLSPSLFNRTEPFDAAIFSYSLSMIPDWNQALRAAGAALKPEGRLHIVDFGDLGRAGPVRSLLRRWLALFHVEPREELLGSLERRAPGSALRTLPLRYAFLFSGDGKIFLQG
jgi:S-adenosylmethionine-diacylgycerolhomoserine-N-methlytransferase